MGTTDIAMKRVFRELILGNVGTAITEAETFLSAWPHPQSSEKLSRIKEEYQLMENYWLRGAEDPQRDEQYLRLLQQVYVIVANISIHRHIQSSVCLRNLHQSSRQAGQIWSLEEIRGEMENFVSETAMLELEPEAQRKTKSLTLYREHHERMKQLFNYVVTSHVWTDNVGTGMETMILSPTIDSIDQQLLVSAISISLMNRFDMAKFRLLVNVYSRSMDEQVRQRALIGWVMAIDDDWIDVYPEQRTLINNLLKSKQVCNDLTELQIQLIYTLNVEKDTSTIEEEIMPDIMKNNDFRITPNGIEQREEDPMEDILRPGASEERMERLEASIQRMKNMQQQGVDVFFSGFSQMKRYPFFYDMCNWLVPFYKEHPDISEFVKQEDNQDFLDAMFQTVPFCNSDKYSFLIIFQQMANQLPANVRELLKNSAVYDDTFMSEHRDTPAYIRRSYLMDLYRFFSLYPNRSSICNPFDTSKSELGMCMFFTSKLFSDTPLEYRKGEVVTMLLKKKKNKAAEDLLKTFPSELHNIQYYMWTHQYLRVLEIDPHHERAMLCATLQMFMSGMYEDAERYYNMLVDEHPEHAGYKLGKAVCLVKLEEYEEALQLLYQLHYEHADDVNVLRVLAWTLTCVGKTEQAEGYYQELVEEKQMLTEDAMNYACCLWLLGKIDLAANYFGKYLDAEGCTEKQVLKAFNEHWLKARGISSVDIKLMIAKVIGSDRTIDYDSHGV